MVFIQCIQVDEANKLIAAATLIVNPSTKSYMGRKQKEQSKCHCLNVHRTYDTVSDNRTVQYWTIGLSIQHSLSMVLGVLFSAHAQSMAYKKVLR